MFLSFILLFVLGYIGYRIFDFLHIPGRAIVGPLVIIAIVTSQGFQWVEMPSYLITFLKVIIGVTVGCRFNKEQVPTIKSYLIPSLISSVWMIFISLVIGFFMYKATGIDLGTALYGSVPSGVIEMGLLALTLNLNVPVVTVLQFVRYLSINLTVPIIVSRCQNDNNISDDNCQEKPDVADTKKVKHFAQTKKYNIGKIDWNYTLEVLYLLFFGSIGGIAFEYLGIPVGGLLGSMLVVGSLRIIGVPLKELPHWLIRAAQILIGGHLGTSFLPEVLHLLKPLLFPIIFFSFFVILSGIFLGFMFFRFLKWDLATALLAASSGGVTLMTLAALEMNADPIKVSIVQTIRVVLILLIMPTLISYIIN